MSYANKLTGALSKTEQQAAELLSDLGQLYAQEADRDKTAQVFGSDGQYTARSQASMAKLRGFWDIRGWDLQLTAWKGTDVGSKDEMTRTFERGFGPERAKRAAALANKVLFEVPKLQGGRNPVLSLNAVSTPDDGLGKGIVLGDGILEAMDTLGFGAVAVEAILGHEYGHQVDFANDHSHSGESSEMGADAYAGYFLSHPKGADYHARLQHEPGDMVAATGDCHHGHGTPKQRKAASMWGQNLASRQSNPNHVLPTATMLAKWDKQYPNLTPAS